MHLETENSRHTPMPVDAWSPRPRNTFFQEAGSPAFLSSSSPPCQRVSRKIGPMRTGSEELYALNSGAGVSGPLRP